LDELAFLYVLYAFCEMIVILREERPKDPGSLYLYVNIDCDWILRRNHPSLILREDSSDSE